MSKKTNNIKKKIGLFLGPLIFIVFLLAPFADISFSAKGGLGLLFWMIIWWISRPVNPTVTALLPIPVIALTGIVPIEYVLAKYFSPIVVLLLGANILTVAWQRWGLDKRLALLVLTKVGSSVRVQVTVWFILTVVLSSIIPNVIVAATLIPIVLATLKASGINSGDIYHSEYATGILLAVAWGSSIGFGTPLGGSMNLVVIQMIEDMVIHQEFMFITWITHMFPLMLAISVPMLLILLNFKYETDKLAIAGDVFKKEYKDLGEFNSGEKWGIIVFVCAILLAFLRPLYLDYLPGLQPSYIFLIAGLIMLLATDKEGERILTWEYAQPRLILFLF